MKCRGEQNEVSLLYDIVYEWKLNSLVCFSIKDTREIINMHTDLPLSLHNILIN